MSSLLPVLLVWLETYGYPALWGTIFIASIGLPLPISIVLLATGALAGAGHFNILLLMLIAITAAVSGDNMGYMLGRWGGSRLLLWVEKQQRIRLIPPGTVERSRQYFMRRGGWAIFLSRFLFSGLGGVLNLLAGAELYPHRRFFLYDLSGEILGAVIPLLLGFIFAASWERVGDLFNLISLLVLILLGVCIVIWLLYRRWRHVKVSHESSIGSVQGEYSGKVSSDFCHFRQDSNV